MKFKNGIIMTEFILTTRNELREILSECLANRNPAQQVIAPPDPPNLLFSIHELASFLGCSDVTAFKLKKSGKIRFKQFGRKLVFNAAEVLEVEKTVKMTT